MNTSSTFVKTVFGTLVLFAMMLTPELGWAQWTYDFGTGTGSYAVASGSSTTFLTSTPANGGTYRVRCASTGNFGAGFILANPGTTLGTASELQINASITASTNKFGVYDWNTPATVAYMKCKFRTTSTGNGSLNISLGTNALGSDNNGYTSEYNISLASLTITYASGAISSVVRRISGSNTTITGSGFSKDANQIVEIYANNGIGSVNYTISGTSYTLLTKTWDLWVDGTRTVSGAATAGSLAASTNLSGFGFFCESSASNAAFMYIDDLEYSNSLPTSATAPAVTTTAVSSIGTTAATFNGNITSDGGSAITERGFCYKTSSGVTIGDNKTSEGGTTTGTYSKVFTVSAATNYFYKAYATNSQGTTLSSTEINFWTFSVEPSAYSTAFTKSVISQTQIDLSFDALSSIANATGYIILKKTGSAVTGVPSDGNAYTVGTVFGDATVAALVTSTSATSTSISSLNAGTTYYFTIIPFNNGSNNATYNYKTDGTIPSTYGTTLAPLDATSEVSGPALGSQPNPVLISSLVTTDASAVRVFDMDVYDYGGDAQPTKITQVTIKPGTHNTANWANTIQGVKLSLDGGTSFATIGTPTIAAASIVIPITSGNLNIPEGNAKTISLYVYLTSSGLTDNQILEFKVDATASSHGFTADATSSTFLATFSSAPVSNQMLIDVVATKLNFVVQPTNVGTAANITPAVTVSANDANGNRDLNYVTNISITANGASLTGTPVTGTPVNGLATFSTLSFSTAGTGVTLDASSGSLAGATSNTFNVVLLPGAGEIVINQFNPAYNGASNEYIELVNKTNKTFDMSQLKIMYSSAGGSGPSSMGTLSGTLTPYSFWLLSPDATITVGLTSSLARDGSFSAGMAAASGQIAVETLGNLIIDGVAYGTITLNKLGEGSPAPTPTVAKDGLSRVPDGVDNNTNSADFANVPNANIYLRNHNSVCISASYTLPSTSYPADVVISGTAPAVALSATTTITGKLTILAGSLTISHDQGLTVTGTLTNTTEAGLVVNSGGSLIQTSVGVKATVQRDITKWGTGALASRGWHFLSSPVSDQVIAPAFTNTTAGNYDFFAWWEPTNQWANYKNTNPSTPPTWNTANVLGTTNGGLNFIPGKGYLVEYAATDTKSFTGTLNKADITISGLAITTGSNQGWHLLGNPFTSALTWGTGDWALTNINATAKIWDEYNSSYADVDNNYPNSPIIPALNGFMVQVTAGFGGSNSLTIPIAARVHDAKSWYKSTANPYIVLVANDPTGQTAQKSIVRFDNQATSGFDPAYDSHFLPGYAPLFYSVAGNEHLSTNSMPEAGGTVQIPFDFIKNNGSTFTIEAKSIEHIYGPVILKDLKTNATQDLTLNPVYAFTSATEDNQNRFLLTFSSVGIGETTITQPITVYAADNIIYISNKTGAIPGGDIYIYNMMGQLMMQQKLTEGNRTKISLNATTGYYLVKVITTDRNYSGKIFIN